MEDNTHRLHAATLRSLFDLLRMTAAASGLITISLVEPALSQIVEYEQDGFSLSLGVRGGIGYVATGNTNFGAGFDVGGDGIIDEDDRNVDYAEGFLQPRIDLGYDTGDFGAFYGGASAIGAITRSNGDPGGFTANNPSDIDLGYLYGGWKSGALFESLGEDALDISVGQQDFKIGDGFIIWDGNLDTSGDAAYWLAPRTAFDMTGLVRFNTEPVRGDAFYLRGDKDQDNSELVGANIEYSREGWGTFGATYFNIIESDDIAFVRDGMNAVSLRAYDVPVPFLSDLTLRGEYVHQWGGDSFDIAANGWYAEAAYSLADLLPWSPTLSYRFSFFSGDPDPNDGDSEAFDALFFGAGRGWGTWFQGEITGEYLLFNSNNQVHMAHLNVAPTDSLSVGLLFFNFTLEESNYFGTPVSDTSFANEVNLYVDWSITDHVYLGIVGGLAWPGKAAKEVFGGDDTYELVEALVIVTF